MTRVPSSWVALAHTILRPPRDLANGYSDHEENERENAARVLAEKVLGEDDFAHEHELDEEERW